MLKAESEGKDIREYSQVNFSKADFSASLHV